MTTIRRRVYVLLTLKIAALTVGMDLKWARCRGDQWQCSASKELTLFPHLFFVNTICR